MAHSTAFADPLFCFRQREEGGRTQRRPVRGLAPLPTFARYLPCFSPNLDLGTKRRGLSERRLQRRCGLSARHLGGRACGVQTSAALGVIYDLGARIPLVYHAHQGLGATIASLLSLSLSLGGLIFFSFRTMWENLEPWKANEDMDLEENILYGVDVTGSKYFSRPRVLRAVEFAAKAHNGQVRRTRDPYVVHCIETARIVEGLLAPGEDDERAEATVIAAILHDTMDDAGVELAEIISHFGGLVGSMVSKVSQLSATNQLVRRRVRLSEGSLSAQEEAQLRHMILTMVSEPLVIVIKLADRLHNMRTVFALNPVKQRAVAEETRRVWCSLAERLGMFAVRSELEDLCFAVLQPTEYRTLRAELDGLCGIQSIGPGLIVPEDCCLTGECECSTLPDEARHHLEQGRGTNGRWLGMADATVPTFSSHARALSSSSYQPSMRAASKQSGQRPSSIQGDDRWSFLTREQLEVKELVCSVLPFDASTFNMEGLNIAPSMRRGLEILQGCAKALLQELTTEGVALGLEVSVQGRVKSLYSTFKKMARKRVPLSQIYDARALRVLVSDKDGSKEHEAIAACYRLLPVVHRLWKRIDGEEDDYIAMPKGSGYRSLHTAVIGPGGVPMEVQIRTTNMHQMAEYGSAAHWAYKERPPTEGSASASTESPSALGKGEDFPRGWPVLRILPGGQMTDGVVLKSESGGLRLTVATSLEPRRLSASAGMHAPRSTYEELLEYIENKGWFAPEQGDIFVSIEQFTLCSDDKYHRLDRFGRKLPTTVIPLPAHDEQKERKAGRVRHPHDEDAAYMNERIRLLRSMLDWGADLGTQASFPQTSSEEGGEASMISIPLELQQDPADQALATEVSPPDVMVLIWPSGKIVRIPRGTTAGEIVRRENGLDETHVQVEGRHVNVNNKLVPEDVPLADGDFVVVTRETVRI